MTREDAYNKGWHEGRREAEEDIQAHRGQLDPCPHNALADGPRRAMVSITRAHQNGRRRGYRDTWARWDAGTLTWEMLEQAPLGR